MGAATACRPVDDDRGSVGERRRSPQPKIDNPQALLHRQLGEVALGASLGMSGGMGDAPFWEAGRIETLAASLADIKKVHGWSYGDILVRLRQLRPTEELPDASGLGRLERRDIKTMHNKSRLTHLMKGLDGIYADDDERYDSTVRSGFNELVAEHARLHPHPATPSGAIADAVFFAALARYMGVTPNVLPEVKSWFYGEEDHPSKPLYYFMYRFSARPGHILKSHLALMPPTSELPICTFVHSAKLPKQKALRVARGIVLPFKTTVSFIGQMVDGSGLKVLTIQQPANPRSHYNGLLMSFDDKDSSIASRFAMVQTIHEEAKTAGLGQLSKTAVAEEITDFEAELYNEIPTDKSPHQAPEHFNAALRMFR